MTPIEYLAAANLRAGSGMISPQTMLFMRNKMAQFSPEEAIDGIDLWVEASPFFPSWHDLKKSILKAQDIKQSQADYELHKAMADTNSGPVQARSMNDDMRFAIEVKRGSMPPLDEIEVEIAKARRALSRNKRFQALTQPTPIIEHLQAVPA